MNEKSRNVKYNIIVSFIIKGCAVIVSLLTIPQYLHYFSSKTLLGVWFAILNLLTWVTMFDFGIGNGLRNKLTEAITSNQKDVQKVYISSTYVFSIILCVFMSFICIFGAFLIDWKTFFVVTDSTIKLEELKFSIAIVLVGVCLHFVSKLVTSVLYAQQKSSLVGLLVLITNLLLLLYMMVAGTYANGYGLLEISVAHAFAFNLPYLIATIILFCNSMKDVRPTFSFCNWSVAKEILSIGAIILFLQIAMMFVGCSHSIFISKLISLEEVTDFNIYFKLFNGMASLFILVLVPIWSSISKAQSEHDWCWIQNVIKKLWCLLLLSVLACLALMAVLQFVFDLWLGANVIKVNYVKALSISAFTVVFVLHNINTSISNGLSFFKPQIIGMSIALIIFIPLSLFLRLFIHGWHSIVIASVLALLPYNILQPISTSLFIKKKDYEKSI